MRTMSQHLTLTQSAFGPLAALAEGLSIFASVAVSVAAYHLAAYASVGNIWNYVIVAEVLALFVIGPSVLRNDYSMYRYMELDGRPSGVFGDWNFAFVAMLVLGFVTKSTSEFSRGSLILTYATGLAGLGLTRYAIARLVDIGQRSGWITMWRVLLVGRDADNTGFLGRHRPERTSLVAVGFVTLPHLVRPSQPPAAREAFDAALERGVAEARRLGPDAVMITLPWSASPSIERCVEAFSNIPVPIQLASERFLDRFRDLHVSRVGDVAALQLERAPLNELEQFVKRGFDLAASIAGLVALSPLFLVVAILIKLDSQGPVFFLQNRYGFNQRPFRIIKFRTMTVTEDGPTVRQATAGDARITRLGRILRRYNIDELPQLVNVLVGQMSIVGPRPHALAHNHLYERRIARYARRHNVKPGITGWAQVHGLRGVTDTEQKMARRVEHDLYYIENWSLELDIRIVLMTVLSPRAYRNAV